MYGSDELDDESKLSGEQEPEPWWRCCCPKKEKSKAKDTRSRSRKKSIAIAEEKLQSVSEATEFSEKATHIEPKHLPLTFVPDFIIGEIFQKKFDDIPYEVTSHVVLLMADVSGFTSLCESYCQQGVAGIEELASVLNGYMSTLSAMLLEGGGDILNFAGDAFLVQWIDEGIKKGLEVAANKAYECAIALQTHHCLQTKNLDGTLKVKIGIAIGEISTWVLGSAKDFLLFVASGPSLPGVQKAEDFCTPGDIVVDENVHKLIKTGRSKKFTPVEMKHGYVKITEYPPAVGHEEPVPDRIQLFRRCEEEDIIMSRIFLIPPLRGLKSADELHYVSELTLVTILFIALLNVNVAQPKVLDSTFDIILACVAKYEGVLNKMLLFDKGCTFLVVFGLPGLKHSNDASRGINCAEDINGRLHEMDVQASIGVSSGTCYCGIVGHSQRQEYTVIGNRVNMAARIMVIYNDQPIALNVDTYHLSRDELGDNNFVELPARRLKGIDSAGTIYAYRKQLSSKSSSIATFSFLEDSDLLGSVVERERIKQCVEAMKDGKKREEMKQKTLLPVLIIKGKSGSGKSYMLHYTVDTAIAAGFKFVACCGISSYDQEPFYLISRLIKRMLGMTMKESCYDRENLLMSYVPKENYNDLYLLNHFFKCQFPVLGTVSTDMKYRNEVFKKMAKTIIREFCNDHYTLIAIDNADSVDDQSWYIIHELAEEEKVLIVLCLTLDFKEINISASMLLLKAYLQLNIEASQENYFAPLLCWFLGVKAVHTRLFVYLKEKTNAKAQILKEISLSHSTTQLMKIVPFESIDKARIQKEFYVDTFSVLNDPKPLACDLKLGVNFRHVSIPTNINDAVKESLNYLTIQDRLLLKRASVLGADFDIHSLESISTGMKRSEVLQSVNNLLSNHIFASVCSLDNLLEAIDTDVPTVSIDRTNICFCFNVYTKTCMKKLQAEIWPIGPYHRLKFRTQEFRNSMLSYMTQEQIYVMRMDVADNLESEAPECAHCVGKRTEGIDVTDMNTPARRYSITHSECVCLEERPRIYSEISVLYDILGMVFLPVYYRRKAAQAANHMNYPIQALYYIQHAQERMPQYWLMSDEDKSLEEAYFDPVVLEISLKKARAVAFLLVGDTYHAASYALQAIEMLGIDAVCFHGAFNAKEFKRILQKFRLLHAECLTKLMCVLVEAYMKAHFYDLAYKMLQIEYVALKSYPIDFIQVLSHMVSMCQYMYFVHKKEKLPELENNIFRICRERVRNFEVKMDLTEVNAIGAAYSTIVEINLSLGRFQRSEDTANEAMKVLSLVNDKDTRPQIRVFLCLIYYYTEQYEKYSDVVFALGKMSAARRSRKFRALRICCLSLFLTKSLHGIHKTEVALNFDKCNAFATGWKNSREKVLPKDIVFYISVVLANWCHHSDNNTIWLAGKDVFKQCYELSITHYKTIEKSKPNYWTMSACIMLLELQLSCIKEKMEISADRQYVKEELDYFKDKIKDSFPIYMELHKKLLEDIEKETLAVESKDEDDIL